MGQLTGFTGRETEAQTFECQRLHGLVVLTRGPRNTVRLKGALCANLSAFCYGGRWDTQDKLPCCFLTLDNSHHWAFSLVSEDSWVILVGLRNGEFFLMKNRKMNNKQ